MADDGNHGVWAKSGASLLRFSATLQTIVSKIPLPKKRKITALAIDATDQSVWVGGGRSLFHLRANGSEILNLTLASTLNDLALSQSVVAAGNRSPVANNDSVITAQNTAIPIQVLSNDSDPDGDPLTIISFTQATNGVVTGTSTVVTYTPKPGFHGIDSFTYTISDGGSGFATAAVRVTVDQPPLVDAGLDQTITLPATADLSGNVTDDGLPNPPGAVTKLWSKVSGPGTVTFGNASDPNTTASFSEVGTYVLRLTGNDGFLSASDDVQITVNNPGPPLPPDPSKLAPPVDRSVATTIDKSTEFLYTGNDPIQTGVAPGTINPIRAAVLRGKVLTRSGTALSGVTITILNHPEFGQTLSRSNGFYDMAINGGGLLTINYAASGFLPAQRQVNVPWQDYVVAADVALIPVDTQVTTITASAGVMQFHQGNVSTDSDGSRKATLLFPAGTTASVAMPDGSTQPLGSLKVRATEYTVGPNGPKSMPAQLPPTSGYTYAVEFSADEALAAGAKSVSFNQPLINYVENFLNFPTGTIVPVGFYDRGKAAWVPSDNGRVIKITAVTAGLADVDTVGTSSLPPVALSDAERRQLASLYSVGQELWRTSIPHFSAWDSNWGISPPSDAISPNQPTPQSDKTVDAPCERAGSIIECQNQILGESVGLVGTPFTLNYRSSRVPGRSAARTLRIALSGASVPASLKRIELGVQVAGRTFQQNSASGANQRRCSHGTASTPMAGLSRAARRPRSTSATSSMVSISRRPASAPPATGSRSPETGRARKSRSRSPSVSRSARSTRELSVSAAGVLVPIISTIHSPVFYTSETVGSGARMHSGMSLPP